LKIDSRLRCALFFRDSYLFRAKPVDPIEYDKKFREKDKKEQLWRYRRDFHKRVLDEVKRLKNE